MIFPVAEFMPDMPDLAEATNIAMNVIALTPQSYGPLLAPVEFSSNALDTACRGLGFAEDTALTHHVFGGTTAKLWAINGAASSWSDVSGAVYAAASGESWRFAQFKNLMLATDFTDAIQSYDMIGGGTFGVLAAAAPKARYLAVAKNFAIAANTNDGVGGLNPARLWWSAFNDPTSWPTPGSALAQQTQSDFNDSLGPQGPIAGLAPNLTGCDCAVFFERGVFRMIYSGPPNIFDFYPAASVKGCPASNSIVPLGSVVYYLGEDGFYSFDGNFSQPIGANKIDKWFFANVDQSAFNLVIGAPDIANKAIIWIFKSLYSPTTTTPDLLLIYRWDIQRWTVGMTQLQWIGRVPISKGGIIVPLTAGQLELAAVDTSKKLAYFSGAPLAAQVGTKVVQLNEGSRSFLNVTRPLVDSGSGSNFIETETLLPILTESGLPLITESTSPAITVAVSARNTYQDNEIFGPEVSINIMGDCPQRSDGRYHRGRISVMSGLWSTMAGLDVAGIRSGLR